MDEKGMFVSFELENGQVYDHTYEDSLANFSKGQRLSKMPSTTALEVK